MQHTRHSRPVFDSTRALVAAREFPLGGRMYAPGEEVPRSVATDRLLRQLWDQGRLKYAPGDPGHRELVARRSVTIGGRTYTPGDVVPPEAVASPTRTAQLVARGDLLLRRGKVTSRPRPSSVRRRAAAG